MKKIALAAAAVASLAVSPANSASLTSVSVFGTTSGATWNTASDQFWSVFLQRPIGVLLNPTDNFAGSAATLGLNSYAIFGEGTLSSTTVNSDLEYRITLNFDDGATLVGSYNFAIPGGQFVAGPQSTATVGTTTYTLNGFGWDRSSADNVSAFRAVSGGDPNDYTGQFSFFTSSSAVPEPATWAMFILGFGLIGAGLRHRNRQVSTTKARLTFA